MEIKNADSGATIERAHLILEGKSDIQRLRRVLDLYSQHADDDDERGPLVIPIPFPGDRSEGS
jgi:hypothetical protein